MATRLRLARLAKGWSLYRLAEEVGVTESFIHLLEMERKGPSAELALRIAAALDLEVTDVFPRLGDGGGRRHERSQGTPAR